MANDARNKALHAKRDGMTKVHVKDEGYGNVAHLSKTVKRGVARMGKGGAYGGNRGVSHWTKDPKDRDKNY